MPPILSRQDRDRHDDDADAAEPLQQGTPQQDPVGRRIERGDHRRAGCRDARHRFEESVGIAQAEFGKHERKRREHGQHQPASGGQDEGLADVDAARGRARRQDHGDADERRQPRRPGEHTPSVVPRRGIDHERRAHRDGECRQQEADDEKDGSEIEHRSFALSLPFRLGG
jgi:hypothetical protein